MNEDNLKTFMQYKEKYKNSGFYGFLDSIDTKDKKKMEAIIKLLENDDIMKTIDLQTLDTMVNGFEKEYYVIYYKALQNLIQELYKKQGKEPPPSVNINDIKNEEDLMKNVNSLYYQFMDYMDVNHDKEAGYKYSMIRFLAKRKSEEKHHLKLCDLVSKTYGREAAEILLERPRIMIADIPNFYIFDDKIRDMIGYGGVHTFMNYDMKSAPIITKIAQNPELIKYYKKFEEVTKDMYPPSAVGLEERLQAFNQHIDLIKLVTDCPEPEKYLGDMKAYIYNSNKPPFTDSFLKKDTEYRQKIEHLFGVKTLQELDGFEDKMNTLLDEMVESGKISKSKMLEFRYLGTTREINEEQYVREYDELGSEFLSNDEVNIIELSSINSKISKTLKGMKYEDMESMSEYVVKAENELYDLIRAEQPHLSSFQIEQIRKKIIEEYKTRYMKSLFSAENLEKEAQETEKRMREGTDSQDSQQKNARRVIKKKDGNLYFTDHMETMDRKIKTYPDYIDDGEYKTREYTYDDDKQFVRKDWEYFDEKYRAYIIGDYTIRFKYSEENKEYVFDAYSHDRKVFRDRDEHVDKLEGIIGSGKIVKQYNPEEQYKLESGDSEFFLVDKVNSANLMLTAIRKRECNCNIYQPSR